MGGMTPAVNQLALIKRVWERIAPLQLAERAWDNVGPIIEAPYPNSANRQVLLTIDLTASVCAEALALPSLSVIIAYHPPIFRGLKSVTLSDPIQASLLKLLQPFLPLSSSHRAITPTASPPEGFEGAGMGGYAELSSPLDVREAVRMVKSHLGLKYVQLAEPAVVQPVTSLAVCAGSGGSVFKGVDAKLLITGEMSHHEVLAYVASGTSVILTNHTNTERGYLSAVLKPWLQDELDKEAASDEDASSGAKWEVLVSKADADPLRVV
ncbi:hypothetical protein I350_02837 [Cryptococcus amylolentus CBS 6273]|uniref:YbgI/family dinuclear metal center protein n=1 Tax=Cryptococcus amylolentus CBS 6273 TaxID=1296118 RepID=A0A1E3K9P1_9TREE|nr:hypothetical protein I350_02837 [Cryptococcus amylolentus CBS 6273]